MKIIQAYQVSFSSNDLKEQVGVFLTTHQKESTMLHSYEVAEEAKKLARRFNVSSEKAFNAGLLHDISVVIPNEERVALQRVKKGEVLEEEITVPMLLHQKQSVFIAKELFGINDLDTLSAIECHTTLKKDASDLDKVVFIADKVKWDRSDAAPYLEELEEALESSLDAGCKVYLNWLLAGDLLVLHPWLKDACDAFEIPFSSQ